MNWETEKIYKFSKFPKVEAAMYTWFHQQRECHAPISDNIKKTNKTFMSVMGGLITQLLKKDLLSGFFN